MESQHWRNRLRQALARQGLPQEHIARLVEELSDHATDLYQENESMDAPHNIEARLGTPEQLAAAAKAEFRSRTFAGRHPLLTFIAGPLVTMVATFAASLLTLILVVWTLDLATGGWISANEAAGSPPSAFEMVLMHTGNGVIRFAPFALSAWCFLRLGRRCGLWMWSLVACGIVALCAICFSSVMTQRDNGPGMWMMGFGWSLGLDQVLQAALPLACVAWAARQLLVRRPETMGA